MKINTNSWNRIRYTIYSPVYDFFISEIFKDSRRKSIEQLNIQPGQKVLIIGAGTGLDLPFIQPGAKIFATDITPSMIKKISKANETLGLDLEASVMDGQKLMYDDNTFDKIILHLILAVIPDPVSCIKECERVLKPGGEITVFDKFVPGNKEITFFRKFLNLFTNLFFSDITRDVHPIVGTTQLEKVSEEAANFNGNFRILKLKK